MRFAVVAALLCTLMVGLGYSYSQDSPAPAFITAPIERGSISSTVRATGTVEAVVTVDVSSQLSGRIAEVFVNFNDDVESGQPIAKLDQEIFAARVSEAKAALDVADTTASMQIAARQRARTSIATARTAVRVAQAQSAAAQAKQEEVERDLQRKLHLAPSGAVSQRELTQSRAQRDTGAAELQGLDEQVRMKEQAIEMAEAEMRMAEASVENARAVEEGRSRSGAIGS